MTGFSPSSFEPSLPVAPGDAGRSEHRKKTEDKLENQPSQYEPYRDRTIPLV